jgi:hypothetical protein
MKGKTVYKSTYPKGGVSFSKESFVVNQTFGFQFKFCGKSHSPSGSCKPVILIAYKQSNQLNKK